MSISLPFGRHCRRASEPGTFYDVHVNDSPPPARSRFVPGLAIAAGLFVVLWYFVVVWRLPDAWPPESLERRAQRKQVLERIQSAGGWPALQRDCDGLSEQHKDAFYFWTPRSTNALPPAIGALKPKGVRAGWIEQPGGPTELRLVHIKVFGNRSTDGHQSPYFGLEVASGPGAETYRPTKSKFNDGRCALVTNYVYEVHR